MPLELISVYKISATPIEISGEHTRMCLTCCFMSNPLYKFEFVLAKSGSFFFAFSLTKAKKNLNEYIYHFLFQTMYKIARLNVAVPEHANESEICFIHTISASFYKHLPV